MMGSWLIHFSSASFSYSNSLLKSLWFRHSSKASPMHHTHKHTKFHQPWTHPWTGNLALFRHSLQMCTLFGNMWNPCSCSFEYIWKWWVFQPVMLVSLPNVLPYTLIRNQLALWLPPPRFQCRVHSNWLGTSRPFLSTLSSTKSAKSWIYDTLRITTMHHWNQCLQDWFCKRRISGTDFTTEVKALRLESMVRVDRVDHLNRMAFWSVCGTYRGGI